MVLKELANGVGAVYLETVILAAELLQQAEIMKRRADEQQLIIECLSCLPSQLIGPEEDPMREWLKSRGVLNSWSSPVASRVSCVSGTSGCTFWNFSAGVGTGRTILGRRKAGLASAISTSEGLIDELRV